MSPGLTLNVYCDDNYWACNSTEKDLKGACDDKTVKTWWIMKNKDTSFVGDEVTPNATVADEAHTLNFKTV